MILRRLARAFRRQDWATVFTELVIVILGVWIGLQASNWNAEHARRATASAARHSLVANLQRDIREFEARERYYNSLYAHADVVLAVMNDPAQLDEIGAWHFVESSYRLGQIWPFAQSGQVYRELEGKGDLDLIGGPDIRVAVAEYYDSWGAEFGITVNVQDPFRIRVRQLMPVALQNHLDKACRSDQGSDGSRVEGANINDGLPRCPAPDMPAPIDATAGEFAGSRELHELARGAVAQMNTTLSVLRDIRADAEILIKKIEMQETR
ncbi:MAG TPA: hypothetical protein VMQ83_12830 [Gammaproteobacteria bacterium]|nr:hypothetical protein [Gammaproteobacteria bacterium]